MPPARALLFELAALANAFALMVNVAGFAIGVTGLAIDNAFSIRAIVSAAF